MRQPLLILTPLFGDPHECSGEVSFAPYFRPPRRQGRRVQFSIFPALIWNPRECRGKIAFPFPLIIQEGKGQAAASDFVPLSFGVSQNAKLR